jgi:endonuclease/exonuclease/phosphatase family metal-dependent hydrolase
MKILTFNLRGFDWGSRKKRSRAFVSLAAPEKPDVILLQEGVSGIAAGTFCSIAQVVRFFADTGLSYNYTAVNMTGYPGILTYRLGILTKKPGAFLGVEEIHNGDSVEWEGPFPWHRKIMGVRSDKVNYYCTHFGGGPGRVRQAEDSLAFIKRTAGKLPVVFGGDFNFTRGAAHQVILAKGFSEGSDYIDKLYYRGLEFAGWKILFNKPEISDHPCMMGTFN